jgi:ComF family protein
MKLLLIELIRRFSDYLFPPLCIVCDKPRPRGEAWLCGACEAALIENNRYRDPCPRCAANRAYGPCDCRDGFEFPFDSIHSLFDFDGPVRPVVHHVKYHGKKHLGLDLARRYTPLVNADFFDGIDGVVAVPLHPSRHRRRGYNQAEYLARGVAEATSLPLLSGVIARVRRTATQATLRRRARRKNMAGAFSVPAGRAECVAGAALLLVDDVVTTGSTTAAAAQALLDAGAASVRVLSFARD